MKQFEKYVSIKECPIHNDEYKISYIDFNTSTIPYTSPQSQNSCSAYTVETKLRKINKSEIKKLIIDKIVELSKKNDLKLSLKNVTKDKINSKIREASNVIAVEGRIGPANRMLISHYNYDKYLKKDFIHPDIEIIFNDSVTDIIIYRKNEPDQPGVILIHNNEKCDILSIGLYPEKHYVRIECDYRLEKLKRILKYDN